MVYEDALAVLLKEHYTRRPLMRATDFYKLIYQGVFGVGHIMGDSASDWLVKECERVNPTERPNEPLIESVTADCSMVRVNLRLFKAQGLPLESLFKAMAESSRIKGDPEKFRAAWDALKGLAGSGEVEVDAAELGVLDEELEGEGSRPHHHSEEYRAAYNPAYRVVTRESLKRHLGI